MSNSPLEQEQDELLTAYLDGELNAKQASEVENRLVHEESLRTRLAELRKSYDLLDEIQETPHNQRFTQSTLELVLQDVSRTTSLKPVASQVTRSAGPRKWMIVLGGLLAIVVGAGAALASHYLRLKQELGDLRLAANIAGLVDAQDYSVVVELTKETRTIAILRRQFSDNLVSAIPSKLSVRDDWFQTLNQPQQAKLEAERDKLRTMNPIDRNRFEAMQKRIESEPNAEAIEETARIISLVMDQVPYTERLNLERLSPDNRRQYLREQMCRAAAGYYFSHLLTEEEAQSFRKWGDETFLPAIIQNDEFYRGRDEARFVNWAVNRFVRNSENATSYPFQDLIMPPLLESLSEESKETLKLVRKEYQLEVLAKCLFEDRLVSESTFLDIYEKTPNRFREPIDLADPNSLRRMFRDPRSNLR